MNDIIPFKFDDATVRVVMRGDDPWFVAGDVARVLGYKMAPHMLRMLDDDEAAIHNVDTSIGSRKASIISESGLYAAILKSRRPEAKRFRRWVTGEVLPAIRRTGRYDPDDPPLLPPPAHLLETTQTLNGVVGILREARRMWGEETARTIWRQCGLPVAEVDRYPERIRDPLAVPLAQWLRERQSCTTKEALEAIAEVPSSAKAERVVKLMEAFGWERRRVHSTARAGHTRWFAPAIESTVQ